MYKKMAGGKERKIKTTSHSELSDT